jgi:hypothetical protein
MVAAPSAFAAFSGTNGKIAYQGTGPDIHVMDPDGSNDQDLRSGTTPSWSPDGTKIPFVDGGGLWVMNADGSLRHQIASTNSDGPVVGITVDGEESHPTWSPDGTKIAFARSHCAADPQLFCTSVLETIDADGTGETNIVSSRNPNPLDPKWSPDGTKIAFAGWSYATNFCCGDIYTVNPDGTGVTQLTNTPDMDDNSVDWSPDGYKLLAAADSGLYTMNRDGTGVAPVGPSNSSSGAWSPDRREMVFISHQSATNAHICTMSADGTNVNCLAPQGRSPDWQPIPYTGYPRPKGATPLRTYLVPAYKPCTAPNRTHGSPLASPSCNPPARASSFLTVGTPDANGQGAKSIGSVFMAARPADMVIGVSITDVRNASDLSDYTGDLQEIANWRITDDYNGPSLTDPATMVDIPFPVFVPCAVTGDTTVGSTCAVSTTGNAVVPGSVRAGKREVVELGQVQVYDGGSDGNAATTADNTLFMNEGVFTP